MFQSSPALMGGCNDKRLDGYEVLRIVSILTRLDGRVQRIRAKPFPRLGIVDI